MLVDEGRESPDIGVRNCVSVGSQVTQDCIHLACVPEHDRIDDEAQRAEEDDLKALADGGDLLVIPTTPGCAGPGRAHAHR